MVRPEHPERLPGEEQSGLCTSLAGKTSTVTGTAYAALRASGMDPVTLPSKGFAAKMALPLRSSTSTSIVLDSVTTRFLQPQLNVAGLFPGRRYRSLAPLKTRTSERCSALSAALSHLIAARRPRAIEHLRIVETWSSASCRDGRTGEGWWCLERISDKAEVILSAGSMFVTAEVKTAWEKRNKM
jgi:hypothetical protein